MTTTHLYQCEYTPEQRKVLEELRSRIAQVAGVTLQGNRLTVRWGSPLTNVHMIIDRVSTPD